MGLKLANYFLLGAKFQLPAGDYALLLLASLGTAYSTPSLLVGLCGVYREQVVKERKEGDQLSFPGLDRGLACATNDTKSLVSSIANERWLIKE